MALGGRGQVPYRPGIMETAGKSWPARHFSGLVAIQAAMGIVRPFQTICGGMAEWLKALAWNACRLVRVSWVRIPLPPPTLQIT